MFEVGTKLIRIQTGQHYIIEKTELSKVKGKLLKKEVLYHLKSEYHSSLDLIVHEDELKTLFKRVKQTNTDRIPCKICEHWSEDLSSCNAPFGFVCTKGYAESLYLKYLQSEAE